MGLGLGPDPDDDDDRKNPDVWRLFRHYDELYFRGALHRAAFELMWTSPRVKTSSAFGSCTFGKTSKTITLHKPLLQHRTKADLKNALLHLMIHAIVFVKHGLGRLTDHGPVFRDWMDAINSCSIEDYLRPKGGYYITTAHDFSEELQTIQGNLWKCESCGDTLLRATKLGPPADSCCIENVIEDATCGNMLCFWHNHRMNCGGTYVLPKRGQKMVRKGSAVGSKRGLLTETSETSESQDAVQESDSDEVQENCTVLKQNTEGRLLPQVGGRNSKSIGSSSSRKASKSSMPEDLQKAIVPATPQRKLMLKQEFVAFEKHELFSIGSCNNAKALGSYSSKKAEDFQKAIVSYAPPLSKPKRKQTSVALEKHELRPVESFYVRKSSVAPAPPPKKLKVEKDLVGKHGDTKPLGGSSTGNKGSKLHKPEGIQKTSVLPAAPRRKLKQDPVASQKNELSSSAGKGNATVLDNISSKKAHAQREHEETRKPIARPAAPQSILKQQNKTNSSTKAEKRHSPQDSRSTFSQPAVYQSKRSRSTRVAPERPKTRSVAPERPKTRSVAPERKRARRVAAPGKKKKEYACFSVWANIYESECSSGSAEPLVNKRTVRRKRERELAAQITYSRSRKPSADGISSIKAQPAEEEISSQQAKPPPQSQCMDFILIDAPDKVVTQDPRGQSKAPATRMDIVAVPPPADKVMTQAPRGQSQPPAQRMDIVQHLADLAMARAHGYPPVPSTRMDIAAVPPAGHVLTRALPVCQSQTPAPCSISPGQVVPPHSADPPSLTPSNPSSYPDVIDISDDD